MSPVKAHTTDRPRKRRASGREREGAMVAAAINLPVKLSRFPTLKKSMAGVGLGKNV